MSLDSEVLEIIKEEEEILGSTYSSLLEQRSRGAVRFTSERIRARELTSGLVAASREEDKAQLASDEALSHAVTDLRHSELESLEQLLAKPYFARFKVREEIGGKLKELEYKLGVSGNSDCRIIDWRKAPISKLYYEYREGEEYSELIQDRERNGVISLRHGLEIDHDRLKGVACRHGRFSCEESEWSQVDANAPRRVGQDGLPEIVSLITPQQFRMITEDAETAVLVQGIAGSGKTTVALHRLAWLLHHDNSDLSPEECLVLVRTKSLKAYISGTLPALEVHGVRIATIGEWLHLLQPRLTGREILLGRPAGAEPRSVFRVKTGGALLRSLEQFCERERARLLERIEREISWESVPSGLNALLSKATSGPFHALVFLKEFLGGIEMAFNKLPANHPRRSGLQSAEALIRELIGDCSNYIGNLLHLLGDHRSILECDETRLLDRDLINAALERTEFNLEENTIDHSDLWLLLRLFQEKNGGIPFSDGSIGTYRHLVLDEVQDCNMLELAAALESVENVSGLTLVGDTGQQISNYSAFPGWDALRKFKGLDDGGHTFVTLTVSHRSTLQIMKLADAVLGESRTTSGREGMRPVWYRCGDEDEGISQAIQWLLKLQERYPQALTAVICNRRDEARNVLSLLEPTFGPSVRPGDEDTFSFDSGIIVTDVNQVKGLEFHSVLLWNPGRERFPPSDYGRRSLYVAITRAESQLGIVTWENETRLLPSIFSPLMDGADLSIDEDQ